MSYEGYREAMWATARTGLPPVPPQPAKVPRLVTITYYGCKEYLRRRGFITEGELVFHRIDPRPVTIADIQKLVADHYGIPLVEMTSERRAHDVARPRQVAMYLAKQLTPKTLPQIGRYFGGRDHTTVIHAVRQVEKRREEDAEVALAVNKLTADLTAPSTVREWREGE